MYLLGILVLLIGLIISVALHELGHLLPAKKFGALVPEYWIGFGPTLISRKFRSTVYGIRAILLGGYVRIVGMFPPASALKKTRDSVSSPPEVPVEPANPSSAAAASSKSLTMVEQARQQSAEEITEATEAGLKGKPFYQLTTPKKLAVMFGGPIMNLVLAVVLTMIVVMGLGWRQATTTIERVVGSSTEIGSSAAGDDATSTVDLSPAAAAGLQAGDQIVAWNGEPVQEWPELLDVVDRSGGKTSTVTVDRGGQTLELTITPEIGEDGVARIGVVSQQFRVRGDFGTALDQVGKQLAGTAGAIVRLPVSLWELGSSFFTGESRDPGGVISVVGVARVAGEMSSAGADVGATFADQLAMMLSLIAALNVALFVFNLIPLPPLDGGHIAGALWGGARNTWARLRKKPLPGPVDTARMVPISYGVFLALMAMTVVLVIADLVKPLTVT